MADVVGRGKADCEVIRCRVFAQTFVLNQSLGEVEDQFVPRRAYGQQRREVFVPGLAEGMGKGSPIAGQRGFVRPIVGCAKQVGLAVGQQGPRVAGVCAGRLLRVPIGHPVWILIVVEATGDEFAGLLGEPKRLACMPRH